MTQKVRGKASQTQAQAAASAGNARSQIADKTAAARQQVMPAVSAGKDQLQGRAAAVATPVWEATPEPVRRAVAKGASTARQRRGPLAVAASALVCRLPGRQVVETAMIKLLYKPVSMLVSVAGGMLAGVIFKRVWKITAREEEAPRATDARRSWREVLVAAALQGAVFALVKAAADRGAAEGTRKLTGVWPGDEGQHSGKEA